jgi:ferredoxin--NADP+ reductase
MFEIISKQVLAQGTVFSNTILAPRLAAKARPGQFLILRVSEQGERIPLTMADVDPQKGEVSIVYQVVGKSTALLSSLEPGQFIQDVVGPLGRPTHISQVGTVLCVGGGTGTAVLHPIARGFKQAGNRVVSIIGARSKDLIIMEEKMRLASHELVLCTDDGSWGHHGFVTEVLEQKLTELGSQAGEAICIGPIPMMKACSQVTARHKVPTQVSLNAMMVDGTGMCGCCRVNVGGSNKFACVDGPEFDGHKVDFDGLSIRLSAYKEQEKISMDNFRRSCQCHSGNSGSR